MYEGNESLELRRNRLFDIHIIGGLHNMSLIWTWLRSVSENPISEVMC